MTIAQESVYKVYPEVARSFGVSKSVPKLEVINSKNCKIPAIYKPAERKIQIEACVIDLAKTFGADSNNVLAIILGHELAHYYQGHEWCADFAWSMRNTNLGKNIASQSLDQRKINESQADDLGVMAASIAGYKPFEIYDKLIDKLYLLYKLPDNMPGYASKAERKKIALEACKKQEPLYVKFLAANFLSYIKDYKSSNELNQNILTQFATRELFNNYGINNLLQVLAKKEKFDFPFILPIELDPETRLKTPYEGTRGLSEDVDEEIENLLEAAKYNFEEAIRKDKNYVFSYENLAITYLLQENYEGALGKLNELLKLTKAETENSIQIRAIAYFLKNNYSKSNEIINSAKSQNPIFIFNQSLINKGLSFIDDKLKLIEYLETYKIPFVKNKNIKENNNSKTVSYDRKLSLESIKIEYIVLKDGIYLKIGIGEGKSYRVSTNVNSRLFEYRAD